MADVEDLARRIAETDLSQFYGHHAAFYLRGDTQDTVKQVEMTFIFVKVHSLVEFIFCTCKLKIRNVSNFTRQTFSLNLGYFSYFLASIPLQTYVSGKTFFLSCNDL
jgi:hypothetical protein